MFSLEQMKALVETYESGTMIEAARRMGKSKSSLSVILSNLEVDLGLQVFDRSRRQLQLTDSGKRLYEKGKVLLRQAEQINQFSMAVAGGVEQQLRIGLQSELTLQDFAREFQALNTSFPHTRLIFIRDSDQRLEAGLANREMDMLIRRMVEGVPQNFEFFNIGSCESILVCAPDHELNNKTDISFEDLLPFPQIHLVTNGTNTDLLKGAGERIEVQRLLDQVQLIELGMGWGFVSRSIAEEKINQGTLVPFFPDFTCTGNAIFMIEALCNSRDSLGPAQRFLIEQLKRRI
ncbi:LysR family transcriptional regulator [Paraferrimonas sedimenticola]|uniref:LysR family transcriptional regulator n=1 Tax=Paraferrimonas sedimenticola TaxID=375674 RepID=A0AA37RMV4_9GAMM|nr:LysR family transcriptional regulator [Paraferrimonas sedimenticola]GLP94940.1 LysR family transcriptional regulator [Paraferrimonas sedimenticola]